MKRKIFIGSSREGLEVASKIKDIINEKCHDWLECDLWKDGKVFEVNKGTLECLIKASRKYDYGIFVASNDDITSKRWRLIRSVRDNVLFEMGLFLGSLGLDRAFLITHSKISLPSDFNGVTTIRYSKKNIEDKIEDIIKELNKTRNSFTPKPVASAALALGYFDNYLYPLLKKINDHSSEYQVEICIPTNLDKINDQIEHYLKETSSIRRFEERPTVYEYGNDPNKFWDIPTTLGTLKELIDLTIPSSEIGVHQEKVEWNNHELRNFVGTLTVLINNLKIYQNKVVFKYI